MLILTAVVCGHGRMLRGGLIVRIVMIGHGEWVKIADIGAKCEMMWPRKISGTHDWRHRGLYSRSDN